MMHPVVELERLRSVVADARSYAPEVSRWSVGMHVHHCCLAVIAISRALIDCGSPPPRSRRPLLAWLLLLTGRIPRGSAQSPKAVAPSRDASQSELLEMIDVSERTLAEASHVDARAWFKHFAYGVLKRDAAIHFMQVHTDHHLRIISDIRDAVEQRRRASA